MAARTLAYGAEAWGRILAGCDRVVVAELLGLVVAVVPEWVCQSPNLDFASLLDC
jgi:hypothetical protein